MCTQHESSLGQKIKLFESWVILQHFLPSAVLVVFWGFFSKLTFSKNYFRDTIRESNCSAPDKAQHFVKHYLGSNCLQSYQQMTKVSTSSERVQEYHTYVILPIYFCPENVVCFFHLLHIIKSKIMEANTMKPDQTAPKLHKQTTNVMNGGKRVKVINESN